MFRKILSYSLRLFLICGISGIGVSLTFSLVQEKIAANAESQLSEALQEVSRGESLKKIAVPEKSFPDGSRVKGWIYWEGKGGLYITEGAAQGYSSKVRVLVGMIISKLEGSKEEISKNVTIQSIKVLFQQETPGLGARIEEVESKETIWSLLPLLFGFGNPSDKTEEERTPWFQAQFRGKKLSAVKKALGGDSSEIGRHITGATITSNAVEKAIEFAVDRMLTELKG